MLYTRINIHFTNMFSYIKMPGFLNADNTMNEDIYTLSY